MPPVPTSVPLGLIAGVHDADQDPATAHAILLYSATNGYVRLHASQQGGRVVVEVELLVRMEDVKSPEERYVLQGLFVADARIGSRVPLEKYSRRHIPVGLGPVVRKELYAHGYRSSRRNATIQLIRIGAVIGAVGIGILVQDPWFKAGMLLGWIVTALIVIGLTSWLTPKGQKLRKRWTGYKPSLRYPKPQDAETELPLIAMLASDKLHDWCRLYTWLGASPQWLECWSDSTDDLYRVLITTWEVFKEVPQPRTNTTSGSASAGSGG